MEAWERGEEEVSGLLGQSSRSKKGSRPLQTLETSKSFMRDLPGIKELLASKPNQPTPVLNAVTCIREYHRGDDSP